MSDIDSIIFSRDLIKEIWDFKKEKKISNQINKKASKGENVKKNNLIEWMLLRHIGKTEFPENFHLFERKVLFQSRLK